MLWKLKQMSERNDYTPSVGTSHIRTDLKSKVLGTAEYTADLSLPNMLNACVLRSPHPHANILSIDTEKAMEMDGVFNVLTPFNVPEGRVAPDVPILDSKVRFVGDEVAVVAAVDILQARAAIDLIEVSYEVLPFYTNAHDSLNSESFPIHPQGNLVNGVPLVEKRGNIEEGFDQADYIVEDSFTTSDHHPASLEPRAALAFWNGARLTVWKPSRGIHADKKILASALDLNPDDITVIGPAMGAGYGSKDETRTSVLAALLSIRTGRPVRLELNREEEFLAGRRRHSTFTEIKMGIKKDGTITAVHAKTIMDTGAYLSSGPGVVRRAGQGVLYLYKCPNVRYEGQIVYTNTPTAGSYRALGAPQGHFALESLSDKASEKLNMDPLEFRLKNHVGLEGQPGERTTPITQIVDTQPVEGGIPFSSNELHQCLTLGAEAIGWEKRNYIQNSAGPVRRGMGMSMFIYRGGPGGQSNAEMSLDKDGLFTLNVGFMDVGEGSSTVIIQMAADTLGVSPAMVRINGGHTDETPESPMTAGSTLTFSAGHAAIQAAKQLTDIVIKTSVEIFNLGGPEGLYLSSNGVESKYGKSVSFLEIVRKTGRLTSLASVTPGSKDYIVNSFGAHFAEIEVDIETGRIEIVKYIAAHDSGRIINPRLAEGQVRGGVSQMMGFTFLEDMEIDSQTGITLNASFLEHKSPTIMEYPEIEVIFVDSVDPVGPFGAKSLGEPPCIPPAPTIANALYHATGVRINDLPLSPDNVLQAMKNLR